MFKAEITKLTTEIELIENKFEDLNFENLNTEEIESLESEVYELESEIDNYLDIAQESQLSQLQKLKKRILLIKKENDFYDAEGELEMMFPNRYDNDFDEDSMSYDSVFGDDLKCDTANSRLSNSGAYGVFNVPSRINVSNS